MHYSFYLMNHKDISTELCDSYHRRKATVLGTKGSILAAVTPPEKTPIAYAIMQGLLGILMLQSMWAMCYAGSDLGWLSLV